MGLVKRIFTSVSGIYNNVNLLTFSGLNDIIVVKDKQNTLKCSDFQLRFGKLYFPNMKTQQVHLIVNDILIHDIPMYITPLGELCFEKSDMDDSQYEEVYGYLDILNRIKEGVDDIIIKKMSQILDLSKEDIELIKKKRFKNIEKRAFFIEYKNMLSDDFYTEKGLLYTKFTSFFSSTEYYNWLIEKYKRLLHIFNGLLSNNISKNSTNTSSTTIKCDINGCRKAQLAFSNCADRRISDSLHKTFKSFICGHLDEKNIVVRISGCETCKSIFYLPYILFTKIYFELRSLEKTRGVRLVELLENEHNKSVGWNFFGKKKILKRNIAYSVQLNHNELVKLNLKYGKNTIIFKVQGVNKHLEGYIYLWNEDEKIIISDIDGTITKSDLLGHIYTMIGKDWTHGDIASLYSKLYRNGYKILYLTSRPLQQSFSTKKYLSRINQGGCKLPDGPVILSPDGLFSALYREIVIRRPEDFKIACLENFKKLFNQNPFVAGFGNRMTDFIAYKYIGIPSVRIFTINETGKLYGEFIGELTSTYKSLNELMDALFPVVNKGEYPFIEHCVTDGFYWHM